MSENELKLKVSKLFTEILDTQEGKVSSSDFNTSMIYTLVELLLKKGIAEEEEIKEISTQYLSVIREIK